MRKRGFPHIGPRAAAQWTALAVFLALYARTSYRGEDVLTYPVHLVFRLDPLALLSEIAATGKPPDLFGVWLGALFLLLATVFLGRFFCGWLCPMGTLLESAGKALRRLPFRGKKDRRPSPATAPVLFGGLFAATLAGFPLLGLLDPLSILLRSLTLAIFPALDHAAKETFAALFSWNAPLVTPAAEGVYGVLSGSGVLAFGRPAFLLAGLTLAVLAGVFALELLAPRFWCAHLCPLGAVLGLTSRLSVLRRKKAQDCGPCAACRAVCPTGAAEADPADPSLCVQCRDCAEACPKEAMTLGRGAPGLSRPSSPTRRALISSLVLGGLFAAVRRARAEEKERPWDFLRPPGALEESEFLRRCIRCGACMRVCPRSALHPCLGEAGAGGVFSPRLVPRLGYCEYHCRLCGQVCPTGAIGYLEAGEKEKWVIGLAVFDRNRCLPYRNGVECLVCEEHCPTNPKAIRFEVEEVADPEGRRVRLKLPRVVEKRCIGCGICEEKCPLPGRAAVRVGRERPGTSGGPYGG